MRIAYYLLTTIFYYLLRPYLYLRILKKKECPTRYQEKLGRSLRTRKDGKLIWFHCSSIGELKSIFPIIDNYLKKNQILVTTSTLSSNEIFEKKYKNTENIIHQYAPIDSPQIIKKFFKRWKPDVIFFTESEIWPNQIFYAKNNGIPIILLNARISNKSFIKWKFIKNSMSQILNCFDLILSQSNESADHFKYFGTNNVMMLGNLKFVISEDFDSHKENLNLENRLIFIALSTHPSEEEICIKAHASLKLQFSNLLTILIPRHINRIPEIEKKIINTKLNFLTSETIDNFKDNIDILVINSRDEELITQSYLHQLLKSQDFTDKATETSSGTKMPRADWNSLEKLEYNLPPITEQKSIASILSTIDDKIGSSNQPRVE